MQSLWLLALLAGIAAAASCGEKVSCDACISETETCGWCGVTGTCEESSGRAACVALAGAAYWISPVSAIDSTRSPSGVAAKPNEFFISLRKGDDLDLDVEVTNLKLPLDLYLIQDLSGSFGDDLPNLKALAPSLLTRLENDLAANSRFGVGSYVDKPQSPFGSSGSGDYVFRHTLAITSSNSAVISAMNGLSTKYGGNYPESQLEALNHVAVCPGTIGWRAPGVSRRMVLLSTDATYHARLHGMHYHTSSTDSAVHNNDDCVNQAWEDYPTIGQTKQNLIDSNVIPIFAVANQYGARAQYTALVENFGFGATETLSSNSDNIFNAIKLGYDNAAGVIVMKKSVDPYGFVSAISPVDGYGPSPAVPQNAKRDFTITMLWDGRTGVDSDVVINIIGFGPVTIHVTLITSCDCSAATCTDSCSGHGTCDCGRCVCTGSYTGPTCDCDSGASCSCSSHGTCECGECKCEGGFSGPDCSCVDAPCPGVPQCSGHGSCACGECTCQVGWASEDDCSCSEGGCPGCNLANGVCDCGVCKCNDPLLWGGVNCDCSNDPCPNACSGHGSCECGACDCEVGFTGTDCSCRDTPCPIAENGLECNGTAGVCQCGECKCSNPLAFSGDACDCSQKVCPNGCTGPCNGECVCGECECLPGWELGPSNDCSCSTAGCEGGCNGNPCVCGECQCADPRFGGPNCNCSTDDCADPFCGGHGTCECGECNCDEEYVGTPDCSCKNTPCAIDPVLGECFGRGTCSCGVCMCDDVTLWEGDDCNCKKQCGDTLEENACFGHGSCECGECVCREGWKSRPVGNETYDFCECRNVSCPASESGAQCGGHGTCDGCGTCVCDDEYRGVRLDCSCRNTPCHADCVPPQGQCECGECLCLPGFRAPELGCACIDTSQSNKTCPVTFSDDGGGNEALVCSGHGKCDECRQECVCEIGWNIEPDCSCSEAGCGETPDACGNGNCTCGECECFEGWSTYPPDDPTAERCQCDLSNPCVGAATNCSGHGTCNECGECECDEFWNGLTCDTCIDESCIVPDPCTALSTCDSCIAFFNPMWLDIVNFTCAWCQNLKECHYRDYATNPDINPETNLSYNTFRNGVCSGVKIDQCPGPQAIPAPPPPPPILTEEEIRNTAIIGGVVIFFILALIVMILRLLTYFKDKKEYEQWEQEKKNSTWGDDDNPLFKKQEQEGANPLYQ